MYHTERVTFQLTCLMMTFFMIKAARAIHWPIGNSCSQLRQSGKLSGAIHCPSHNMMLLLMCRTPVVHRVFISVCARCFFPPVSFMCPSPSQLAALLFLCQDLEWSRLSMHHSLKPITVGQLKHCFKSCSPWVAITDVSPVCISRCEAIFHEYFAFISWTYCWWSL